ncbi:hypothetical protein [Kitasatospora purpeofusca]|uniref:hypothetical protein n=1 Tax=Kitasatospora purpeofusca TaxID=67352 RepID=UPI0038145328
MKTIADTMSSWVPQPSPTYDADSYPTFYAVQFLADEPWQVPDEIRHQVDREVKATPNSQGKDRKKLHEKIPMARLYLRAWLNDTGEDPWTACLLLADGYLASAGIQAPVGRQLQGPDESFRWSAD